MISKNTKNNTYKHIDVVSKYLVRRSKSKMTTEKICEGVNKTYNTNLTIPQVSICLTRLCNKNMAYKLPAQGTTSNGRTVCLWSTLNPSK